MKLALQRQEVDDETYATVARNMRYSDMEWTMKLSVQWHGVDHEPRIPVYGSSIFVANDSAMRHGLVGGILMRASSAALLIRFGAHTTLY